MELPNSSELVEMLFRIPPTVRTEYISFLYVPYSRKNNRPMYCYGHDAYDVWLHLEADVAISSFNTISDEIAKTLAPYIPTPAKPIFASNAAAAAEPTIQIHCFCDGDVQVGEVSESLLLGASTYKNIPTNLVSKFWSHEELSQQAVYLENLKKLLPYVSRPHYVGSLETRNLLLVALGRFRKVTVQGLLQALPEMDEDVLMRGIAELILDRHCHSDIHVYPFHFATELSIHHDPS